MKTVVQWIESLPEPYMANAMRNLHNPACSLHCPDMMVASIRSALMNAFSWRLSQEGFYYWFYGIPRFEVDKTRIGQAPCANPVDEELPKTSTDGYLVLFESKKDKIAGSFARNYSYTDSGKVLSE